MDRNFCINQVAIWHANYEQAEKDCDSERMERMGLIAAAWSNAGEALRLRKARLNGKSAQGWAREATRLEMLPRGYK